jgi:hypothetical protein
MTTLGYCAVCKKPVTAYAPDACAMTRPCDHPTQFIAWLASRPSAADSRAKQEEK